MIKLREIIAEDIRELCLSNCQETSSGPCTDDNCYVVNKFVEAIEKYIKQGIENAAKEIDNAQKEYESATSKDWIENIMLSEIEVK